MTFTYGRRKASVMHLQAPSRPSSVEIALPARATISLRPSKVGVELYCPEGRLWITQAGDARDYILESGDHHRIADGGLVVVQAMASSTLRVLERD
jgi:hypothetical protein